MVILIYTTYYNVNLMSINLYSYNLLGIFNISKIKYIFLSLHYTYNTLSTYTISLRNL